MSEQLTGIVPQLRQVSSTLAAITARLEELLASSTPPAAWAYPVGSAKFPVAQWYCAQFHKWTPRNLGGHTGLDLNVQVGGRGGIDEGQPVYALADGIVEQVGSSPGWLGVVILRVDNVDGGTVWFRYGHLHADSIPVQAGQYVIAGDVLGYLGDYRNAAGYKAAHLHLDAAVSFFNWNEYRAPDVQWVDPLPILKRHLDPELVEAMISQREVE